MMTEAEILVALKQLYDLQQKVGQALHEQVTTFMDEDEGDIDRALGPALALQAIRSGDFYQALKAMGGAE